MKNINLNLKPVRGKKLPLKYVLFYPDGIEAIFSACDHLTPARKNWEAVFLDSSLFV